MKPKRTFMHGHVVCFGAALVFGVPLWIVWTYLPPLFPFLIAWLIVRPIYKIWTNLDES